ncbi:hypothetical protein ACFYKT_03315 [Cytobacillus sp. FJAT-53684]|uniref:Uncharacterized protein n=1 Tax=Cytobacillus mangrovibacter TaxID=3299024 RepID=A0ABW6JX85_9BACI
MDFLFDNPFIPFVLVAIITALFNKGKGKNQEKNNHLPKRQPVQTKQSKGYPMSAPVQEARKSEKPSRMPRKVMDNIEREYLDRKKQVEAELKARKDQQSVTENRTRSFMQTTADQSKNNIAPPLEKERKTAISIEKQKLVDGIIWSEILGPPRALNPHRSINRDKRVN